jgi:uncharacterized membrane protein YdbT with pleckstrin-like domain
MGRYVEANLLPGEDIVHAAQVSNIIYLPYVLLMLFLIGMGFLASEMNLVFWGLTLLVGLGGLVICGIRKISTEVAVTNKRLILKTGFIRRETVEQFLEKIDSISVEQSITDRIVNAGTIIIRGSGQSFSPVSSIDEPLVFRKIVNEQVDKIKSGR